MQGDSSGTALEGGCYLVGCGSCLGLIIAAATSASTTWTLVSVGLGAIVPLLLFVAISALVAVRRYRSGVRAAQAPLTQEVRLSRPQPDSSSYESTLEAMDAEIRRLNGLATLYVDELKAATRAGRSPSQEFLVARANFNAAADRWAVIARHLQEGIAPTELGNFSPAFWEASAAMERATNDGRRGVARLM